MLLNHIKRTLFSLLLSIIGTNNALTSYDCLNSSSDILTANIVWRAGSRMVKRNGESTKQERMSSGHWSLHSEGLPAVRALQAGRRLSRRRPRILQQAGRGPQEAGREPSGPVYCRRSVQGLMGRRSSFTGDRCRVLNLSGRRGHEFRMGRWRAAGRAAFTQLSLAHQLLQREKRAGLQRVQRK